MRFIAAALITICALLKPIVAISCYSSRETPDPSLCQRTIALLKEKKGETLGSPRVFHSKGAIGGPTSLPREELPKNIGHLGCTLQIRTRKSVLRTRNQWDESTWASIIGAAELILRRCVESEGKGGKGYVGLKGRIKVELRKEWPAGEIGVVKMSENRSIPSLVDVLDDAGNIDDPSCVEEK